MNYTLLAALSHMQYVERVSTDVESFCFQNDLRVKKHRNNLLKFSTVKNNEFRRLKESYSDFDLNRPPREDET